jgi:4-hydroxy-tetrahydrodipicolinate synthase
MPPLQVWVGNEPDLPTVSALGSNGAVSGVANLMPQVVARLVGHHPSSNPSADMQRLQAFLAILGGYGMTAAFKGMMAHTTGHAGWRRVRPPLVALNDAEYRQLQDQMTAFHLDPTKD